MLHTIGDGNGARLALQHVHEIAHELQVGENSELGCSVKELASLLINGKLQRDESNADR